jgi:hypothetical protein
MKKWISAVLAMFFSACSMFMKSDVSVRDYNLHGSVSQMEELTAYPISAEGNEEIRWEDLDFATTYLLRIHKKGTKSEETFFSKYGEKEKHIQRNRIRNKNLQISRVFDENDNLVSFNRNFLTDSGKIQKIETYQLPEEMTGKDAEILGYLENYQNNENKLEEIVFQYSSSEMKEKEIITYFQKQDTVRVEIFFNENGKKTSELYYNKTEKLIGKATWEYFGNLARKDIYNETLLISRMEETFDEHGNPIIITKHVPTFQAKLYNVDWEGDNSNIDIDPFQPENYQYFEVEKIVHEYEYDTFTNWVLRKTYRNKELTKVTERKIEYF